jgi:hypothetical protein
MPKILSIDNNSNKDPKEYKSDDSDQIRKILKTALEINEGKYVFLFGDCGEFNDKRKFTLNRVFIHEDASEILRFYDAFQASSRYEESKGEYVAWYFLQMHEYWEAATRILHMLTEGCTDKCYDKDSDDVEPPVKSVTIN